MKGDAINYCTRASSGTVEVSLRGGSVLKGDILSCNMKNRDDKLYLGFSRSHVINNDEQVSLVFFLKSSYFERLISVVSALKENMIERIIPNSSNFVPRKMKAIRSNHSSNLSPQQMAAFQCITTVSKGSPPVLITGSFGCGKTHVLAKSVLSFLSEDNDYGAVRVLVGTQQHVSADSFLKLFHQFHLKKDPELYVIRLTPSNYSVYSRRSDSKYFISVDEIEVRDWSRKNKVLVITTCSTSFTAWNASIFPAGYFTHVLLDECAQMREPEAIAPLCLAHPEAKIAMAGDQQQVRKKPLENEKCIVD